MHISKRLKTIVNMVSTGHCSCDVGCDHAYTSIALVKNGICPYAVASDVRPGPLAAARKNIEDAGLKDRISVRLADGVPEDVHEILPEGKKTLIMTGMGGLLICGILERAGDIAAAFDEMILSPQSDTDFVRRKLIDTDYEIADEEMMIDEGKYYVVIRAVRRTSEKEGEEFFLSDSKKRVLTGISLPENTGKIHGRAEMLYGPVLLKKKHPVLLSYIRKQEKTLDSILENLRKAGRGPDDARYREVVTEMEVLHEAEKYYEDD